MLLPSRMNPETLADDPIRTEPSVEMEPKAELPKALSELPSRANPRVESVLPMIDLDTADCTDPELNAPTRLTVLPIRQNPETDRALPKSD